MTRGTGTDMDRWITDTEPSERFPIYSRANAGEVAPNPLTPLSATLNFRDAAEPGWRLAYTVPGTMREDELDPDRPSTIGIFGSYLFLNMSITRLFGVRCPGMTPELVDLQYFGTMPGIPPYVAKPGDEDPEATARVGQWLAVSLSLTGLPEIAALKAEVDAAVAARPDLARVDDAALVARARSVLGLFRRVFHRHIEMSALCGIGIGTVAGVCQAVGRPELVTVLTAGAGDVESAEPSRRLWTLSRLVAASAGLTARFDAGVPGLAGRLANDDDAEVTAFRLALAGFTREFGFRGPDEWELASATWESAPDLALAAIDRMRLAPDGDDPLGHVAGLVDRREAAAAPIRAGLTGADLAQFETGLRSALLYSAGRERTKATNIKLVNEQRVALRELGRRLCERGRLTEPDRVFMVTADELDELVRDPTPFGALTDARHAEYRAFFDVEPPFVFTGPPPPVSTWRRRDRGALQPAGRGTVLTGIPGSAGRVTGRARIVLDPADPRGLEPGDVLVAPATDPGWTPLFVPAAAVVVDVGAQITHAVIVSRELGIPCVVSVTDATRRIVDGSLLEVDGSTGTVTVVADAG